MPTTSYCRQMPAVTEMSKFMTYSPTVTAKFIGCPVERRCHQLVFSTVLRSSGRVQIISAIRRRSWSLVESLRGNSSVSLCSSLWRILNIMSTTSTSCFPWTHTFRSYKKLWYISLPAWRWIILMKQLWILLTHSYLSVKYDGKMADRKGFTRSWSRTIWRYTLAGTIKNTHTQKTVSIASSLPRFELGSS